MSGTKSVTRCLACGGRIRDSHPHIEVTEMRTGVAHAYHGRLSGCRQRALEVVERGQVYLAGFHHTCGDEASGFDCAGRCFTDGEPIGAS
jgi:hypothetical protein